MTTIFSTNSAICDADDEEIAFAKLLEKEYDDDVPAATVIDFDWQVALAISDMKADVGIDTDEHEAKTTANNQGNIGGTTSTTITIFAISDNVELGTFPIQIPITKTILDLKKSICEKFQTELNGSKLDWRTLCIKHNDRVLTNNRSIQYSRVENCSFVDLIVYDCTKLVTIFFIII